MNTANCPFYSTNIDDETYRGQTLGGFMPPTNNAEWQTYPNVPNELSAPEVPPDFFSGFQVPTYFNNIQAENPFEVPMDNFQNFLGQTNETYLDYTQELMLPSPNQFDQDVDMEDVVVTQVVSNAPVMPAALEPPPVAPEIPRDLPAARKRATSRAAAAATVPQLRKPRRPRTAAQNKKRTASTRALGTLEEHKEAYITKCRSASQSKILFVLSMVGLDKGLSKNPSFEELVGRLYAYANVDPEVDGSLLDAWHDVWEKLAKLHPTNKKKRQQYIDQHQAQIHWRMSAYFVRAVANTSRFRDPVFQRIDVMKRISFVLTLGFNGGCTPTLLIPVNTWKKKEFRQVVNEYFDFEPKKRWGTFDVAKDAFLESSRALEELEAMFLASRRNSGAVLDDDAVITSPLDNTDF